MFVLVVIVGEISNFVAYVYAPAVLVTPLGALSIIVRYLSLLFGYTFSSRYILQVYFEVGF